MPNQTITNARRVSLVAGLCLGLIVVWGSLWHGGIVPSTYGEAYFEWDASSGFKVFRILSPKGSRLERGPVWQSIVKLQLTASLSRHLRQPGWRAINGRVPVEVAAVIPLARFIALGGDGDILEDPTETSLMRAAGDGNDKLVNQLLAAGADVNARDQRGESALMYACLHGKSDVLLIRDLLAAGADVNATDRWGRTALYFAVQTTLPLLGRTEGQGEAIVRQLIAAGADVNVADNNQVSVLMKAARDSDIMTVRHLLRAGADVNKSSNNGETAISIARENGNFAVVRLLIQYGAKIPTRTVPY